MTAVVHEGQALLQMLLVAAVSGVGGAAAFGLVIACAGRTALAHQRRRRTAAAMHGGACALAGLACVALVVVGPLVLLTS